LNARDTGGEHMGKPDLRPGDAAVPFDLPDAHEKSFRLEDIKGRWLVLYFYPKDQTPGCSLEAGEFTRRLEDFHALGAEVAGVSPDSPESHCNFIGKQNLKLILLSDEKKDVINGYGAWKLKKQYGREYFGVERSPFLIDPAGIVAAVWRGVKVPGHVDAVLAELKDRKAGFRVTVKGEERG
jgi:thioredoxin-dependent peroxiredoxin